MENKSQSRNGYTNSISCAAKTLAALFAMLFILSTVFSTLLVNTELILLRPGVYKKALSSKEAYEKLPDMISRQIAHELNFKPCLEDPTQCVPDKQPDPNETQGNVLQSGPPAFMQNLGEEDWAHIFSLLLTKDWLQSQTESLLDQVFTGLNSGQDGFELLISMDGIRENLNEENSAAIITTLLVKAPPCSAEEQIKISSIALGQSGESMPVCIPTEELKPFLQDELKHSIQALAADIPKETNLKLNLFEGNDGENNQVNDNLFGKNLFATLKLLRGFFLLSLLIPMFALLMITLFAVRSWFSFLRWWGIPFLLSGLLILLPAAGWLPVYQWLVNTVLLPNIPVEFTSDLINLLLMVAQNVVSRFTFWIGLEGGLLFLLGCGMCILSPFLRSRTKSLR